MKLKVKEPKEDAYKENEEKFSGRKNSDNTKTKQQKNVIFIAQEP